MRNENVPYPGMGAEEIPSQRLERIWQEFQEEFPTERDCFRELLRRLTDGFRCPHCNAEYDESQFESRKMRCERCRRANTPTAQTFFHRVRKARPWLARIRFAERGVCISSLGFSKLLDIASSTALEIFKKIMTVVESLVEDFPAECPTREFISLFSRRSIETPARAHPREEEAVMRQAAQEGVSESFENQDSDSAREHTDTIGRNEVVSFEDVVFAAFSTEPIDLGNLSRLVGGQISQIMQALTFLELEGRVQTLPGGLYVRVEAPGTSRTALLSINPHSVESPTSERVINDLATFVDFFFQGVSRKDFQHYAGAHWCFVDRLYWRDDVLMNECVAFRWLRRADLLSYVTPLSVRTVG